MMRRADDLGPLERYTAASEAAAQRVIAAYSTSFGLATRLLGARHRTHIRNIYALVRIADELVDGVAEHAGVAAVEQRRRLAALEDETEQAMRSGYSSNPIVHAFAVTARDAGIDVGLTRPFFASMRMDLPEAPPVGTAEAPPRAAAVRAFDVSDHAAYVYGSAEVVGLMCLRVFMRDEACSAETAQVLEHGARQLGAAFQNVNFLRDLGDDADRLKRDYLGGEAEMTPELQRRWIETIRAQLADAEQTVPLLPSDARSGCSGGSPSGSRAHRRRACAVAVCGSRTR
jgi:phytoene/squalene synthetase